MAAGLGFKTFTTGEVLTAADVNGYLMQGLLVFANAAARDAAITSPQEGQACYLKDTDAVLTYSGSAWVGFDDSNAIQNSIINAKGDLIAGSANDTPAILAAGNSGETLVADSAASTGLRYQATKSTQQAIINGGMDIWQRGTSFAYNNQSAYSADRWYVYCPNTAATITRQAGTGEFQYLMRLARNNATSNTGVIQCNQTVAIDEATQFAGKTVTLSFYARAGANFSAASSAISVSFLSGTGSTDVNRSNSAFASGDTTVLNTTQIITSTLTRYSFSFTLGATVTQFFSAFGFTPVGTAGANDYFEITGVQLEVGSVATTFRRAGGTLQGEYEACKRYYERFSYNSSEGADTTFPQSPGPTNNANLPEIALYYTEKRTNPTISVSNGTHFYVQGLNGGTAADTTGFAGTLVGTGKKSANLFFNMTSWTATNIPYITIKNSSGWIEASAEL